MKAGRLPGLDGLRAVAIALAVLRHIQLNRVAQGTLVTRMLELDLGNLGVRIFFVLSGFLITTLLLSEHEATGRISLPRFYLRRSLRIMPAYYAFLAAMAGGAVLGLVPVTPRGLPLSALYASNYFGLGTIGWTLAHTWSLSVEEQFYLLWPGALVLAGARRGFLVAAVILAVSPVFRVLATHGAWHSHWRTAFECVADALATGCLLAYLRGAMWAWTPYRDFLSSRAIVLLPVLVLELSFMDGRSTTFAAVAGISLLNVSVAVIVDWVLHFPAGHIGRALNWRPIAFVGTLSYSLYLWQQPFLSSQGSLPVIASLGLIGGAALLSYFVIERPALRLRTVVEGRRAW